MLSDFELTKIAKLIDPAAGGMFRQYLKNAAKAGAEKVFEKLLTYTGSTEVAEVIKDFRKEQS